MTELIALRDRARSVPPTPGIETIQRSRLDELYESSRGQVLRVLAPGGFGKSTLVSRWAADDDRQVVWLDLERIDNDSEVLTATLSNALADLDAPDFLSLPSAPAGSQAFARLVVPALGDAVRAIDAPFVLVIDDIHVLSDPGAGDIIDAVAENLSESSTLVLVGRAHRVDGSVARLRLRPGVRDVGVSDLALDIDESRQLLGSMGLEIGAVDPEFIERFEGWPAGLRLAGLVTQLRGPRGAAVPIADATYVTDYLSAEWTATLAPDDRRLLSEAACLGRFTGEMCDAILGRSNSSASLRRVQHDEQLVLPLDERGRWFRMHPILAGWLESELQNSDRRRWCDVHLRASEWWAAEGDIDLAIEHAVRVGDIDRCEELVATHAAIHFPMGANATVQRWLGLLPADRVRTSPPLCALASIGACHVGDGDRALQWNAGLARQVGIDSDARDVADETSMIAEVLRSLIEPLPATELIASARRGRDHLPAGPWQVAASWALGGNLFMVDDDAADEVWTEGALAAEFNGTPMMAAHCLGSAAIRDDLIGERQRSTERAGRAQQIVRAAHAQLSPPAHVALAASALHEAHRGHRDEAEHEIAIVRGHLHGYGAIGPWFNVLARLALIRATMVIGDHATSRELLREAEFHASRQHDAVGARRHVAALRTQVDSTPLLTDHPSGALTPAERRVLVYLPTNLSLADIATQLFVSRNTVKTHAAAIYRKLGTSSRSEAVELARGAGLLDDAASLPEVR